MFLLFSTLKISSSVTKSSCTLLTVSIDHMKLFITCRFFILPSEPPTFVKNSTLLSSTVTGNMSAAQEIALDWQKQQRQ